MSTYFVTGRFPIIDKTLTLSDELAIPRSSDADCIAFILKDFDEAALKLPSEWSGSNLGRATKGACYALKARLLLNTHNYADAALACTDVFALGYELFNDFSTLFSPENDNNSGVIFDKQFGSFASTNSHWLDLYENSPYYTGFSSGITCPTQNMVDAFELTDGNIWDESPLYDASNPYANRDPRFYTTVLYDGAQWAGAQMDLKKGSAFNASTRGTPTGYFFRKLLNPNYDFGNYAGVSNHTNAILIRLAEVYLIYAECQFKLGEIEDAREYVNMVRRRVNMPDVLAADFSFESIKHERQVELAFEGQRWNDARRWQEGAEIIGATIFGITITEDAGVRTYSRIEIENRSWDDKMYLFPIPSSEIEKYPADVLEQNPGWEN